MKGLGGVFLGAERIAAGAGWLFPGDHLVLLPSPKARDARLVQPHEGVAPRTWIKVSIQ